MTAPLQRVFKLPPTYITKDSQYPDEFLTTKEVLQAIESGEIKTRCKTFKGNYLDRRGRLPLYLGDDPKNVSRPILVEFKAISTYGVTKYKKTSDSKTKENDGSWSIAFSVDENPTLAKFTDGVDDFVSSITTPFLPQIYESLLGITNPEKYPVTKFRKCARSSDGSTSKYFRLTIPVGRTEFGPADNLEEFVSLSAFPQDTPGIYHNVALLSHIDVQAKKGTIEIGPVFYAKMVRNLPVVAKTRRLRDDTEFVDL